MKLDFCTITGLDNAVDPIRLTEISTKYPFVEWAILYSPADMGAPRYPTVEWIARFHEICPDIHKSTHLCRQGLSDFINGDSRVVKHISKFPRVQLNFSFEFDIDGIDQAALAKQMASAPNQFILQYNDRTQHLLPLFRGMPNTAVLLDASAGRGERPDKWSAALPGCFCGRAGGIGPDNIGEVLDSLLSIVPPGQETWLDMETRVRTNNQLDIGKVLSVLETVRLAGSRLSPTGSPNLLMLDT